MLSADDWCGLAIETNVAETGTDEHEREGSREVEGSGYLGEQGQGREGS